MSKTALLIFAFILAFGVFGHASSTLAMAQVPVDGGDGGGGNTDGGGGGTGGGTDTGGGSSGSTCDLPGNMTYMPINENTCNSLGYTAAATPNIQYYRDRSRDDGGYEAFMDASYPLDGGTPVNINQCGYAKPAMNGAGYILLEIWELPSPPTCSTPAPTANISATPTSIVSGASTKLSWSSTHATNCTIEGVNTGGAVSGSANASPDDTTTYTLVCTGAGGSATDSVQVTVTPAPEEVNVSCTVPETAPINTSVPWSSIAYGGTGGSSAYNWVESGSNRTKICTGGYEDVTTDIQTTCDPGIYDGMSCSASQAGSSCRQADTPPGGCTGDVLHDQQLDTYHVYYGNVNHYQCQATASQTSPTYSYSWTGDVTGNTQNVSKPYSTSGTKTATVKATANSGYASAVCSTNIVAKPTVTLTANPSSITSGSSSTLTWSSSNAGVCTSPDFETSDKTSGSVPVTPSATKTYHITCDGDGGEASASATVTVGPANTPDLIAGATSAVFVQGTVNALLKADISNIGIAPTGAGFTVLFQKGTDANGSSATDIGTDPVAALTNGSSEFATIQYDFGSSGTYYVRACADKSSAGNAGVIAESNENNNCGAWTKVTASQAPARVSCSLSASPTGSIPSTLTWSSSNASTCRGGGFSTGEATSGSVSVSTAGAYTLTCTDKIGNFCTDSVTVSGGACTNPSASISANPGRIQSGGTTQISYNASGVDGSCTISGPGAPGSVPAASCTVPNGSFTTPALTTQTTYTITCGDTSNNVIVNVVPNFTEF